ncbi:xanthine dehydrogenase family protein molybdopterin-binding subunit [Hymenobacter sp. GOD-10R]|uniref:xanthine dehydrogenase family protein molybdopterin-binding subunit n=1 Tax=Hymenobacter sp. GOD-10R TaxID=3093922 RepID=UPI002D7A2AEC|nr:xanthine dehydrogenase family protein molybdopterin-binding subunit [Hymenobacter sp. GOD-10R]WRQ30653.1 xanthine dehydrogenase family protein molybdopterin-binding subunit [Hymenobacter sp. GOD-10R]
MSQTIASPPTVKLGTDYVGQPTNRVDGPAKVTGAAPYAADFAVADLWYGYVVNSPITKGRITKIDTAPVLALPGVKQVFTHENVPPLAAPDKCYQDDLAPNGSPFRPLHSPEVVYNLQPVALVVADTFELARYAASILEIEYEVADFNTNLAQARHNGFTPGKDNVFTPPTSYGHFEQAYAAATYQHTGEYAHPPQHHNPMELFATTVEWLGDGRKLKIYDKTQGVFNTQQYLCSVFGLDKTDAQVITKYMGGGFGAGLRPQHQAFLATLAALELQHSVRLTLTRDQMFSMGNRPAVIQNLKLGTDEWGHLTALQHHAVAETSRFEKYADNVVPTSGVLYNCDNVSLEHQIAALDIYTPQSMRAPGAASGEFALEVAIDEMAYLAGRDPLEFRLLNYSETDKTTGKPFSSKRLRDCYHEGAAKFGWDARTPEPRSMRDGNLLVGWGVGTGIWDAMQMPTKAKAVLTASGHLTVSSGSTDIGTGTYTIMTQMAAQTMGLPLEDVTFVLGDTSLPQAPLQGGSWMAASLGSAVQDTCQALGKKVLRLAQQQADSPLAGLAYEDVQFAEGVIRANDDISWQVSIRDVLAASGEPSVEATGGGAPDKAKQAQYSMHSHNAVFVEVKIDEDLGIIRVTRVVNAVAAGRIMNTKTARSQVLGSVVWGIGMALMEATVLDNQFGRYMNHNYGEYHVPVNADIHKIDVIFVEENDTIVNPIGVKGIGEVGMLGVTAAVANAIYHATGKRVRELPITLDKLL